MPLGQAPLDGVPALEQPVHGGVEIVLAAVFQPRRLGERVSRGRLGQAPGGGQFRAGVDDPGDDHRQHAPALGRVRAGDRPVQAQLAQRPERGGDMAVGPRANDVEGVVEAGHRGAALEQHAQALDQRRGPFGEVGEGAFPDLAALAPAFAQEDGGRRAAVWDGFDVHGNGGKPYIHQLHYKCHLIHGNTSTVRKHCFRNCNQSLNCNERFKWLELQARYACFARSLIRQGWR